MTKITSGKESFIEKFKGIYERNYRKFFIIPALAVLFCLAVLGTTYFQTGEFVRVWPSATRVVKSRMELPMQQLQNAKAQEGRETRFIRRLS